MLLALISLFLICAALLISLIEVLVTGKAPFVQAPNEVTQSLKQFLNQNVAEPFVLYDLGCGTGNLLKNLARDFKSSMFLGVENSVFIYILGLLNVLFVKNVKLQFRSISKANISGGTVFYCWLFPQNLNDVYQKVKNLHKKGTYLVSCDFAVPNVAYTTKIATNAKGSFGHTLYVYAL